MNLNTLTAFDVTRLPAFYPGAAADSTDSQPGLSRDYRMSRRLQARTMIDATKVANAARHLDRLPERDECIHIVCRGLYDLFDFTPAILDLAGAPADEALYATLGFNMNGAKRLFDLIDAGRIRNVWFLASVYFQGSCRTAFDYLAEGLIGRGQHVAARRNHAKIQAFKLVDGRCIVLESSGNLRSCRNTEQTTITESPDLYAFHKTWITELFAQEDQK